MSGTGSSRLSLARATKGQASSGEDAVSIRRGPQPGPDELPRQVRERQQAEGALRHRLEFEKTVACISSRFVGASDIDSAIDDSLADVGRLTRADRAYVFLLRERGTTEDSVAVLMDNTHEWCAKGVTPQIGSLQSIRCDTVPWWMSALRRDDVIHIPDVSALPVEAAVEKRGFQRQDIKSLVALPLHVAGELVGFIGLDNVKAPGQWSQDHLELLRIVAGILSNAVARQRADQALQESERRYRAFSHLTSDYVFRVTPSARGCLGHPSGDLMLRWVSGDFELGTGYAVAELEHESTWHKVFHPEDFASAYALIRAAFAGEPGERVCRIVKRSGEVRWAHFVCRPEWAPDGEHVIGVLGAAQDIHERKQAEERLLQYQEQLRALASQLSLAEERERRRIARDLHDGIGQNLALAQIKLDTVRAHQAAGAARKQLDEIRAIIDRATREARSLTYDLSPPALYELGFERAAQDLCQRFGQEHGLGVTFRDDGQPKPLSEHVRVILFRALRETLINVVKHAEASKVDVSVVAHNDDMRVDVRDDGVGFDTGAEDAGGALTAPGSRAVSGFGLFSIHERLQHLGGRLDLESSPGAGTRVTLVAPLSAGEDGARMP